MNFRKIILSLALLLIIPNSIFADGTYANIGTATATNGSPDVVSWSQGFPIVIDSFGKYIVPVLPNSQSAYNIAYSNNLGATWSEIDITGTEFNNRASMVYDSIHDKLHVIDADNTNGTVKYKRYIIKRNSSYNITGIIPDPSLTALTIDNATGCASATAGNPVALFKDNGANGILAVFWSVQKTNCTGVNVLETRGAMLTLSNSSSDGTASNWKALNGTSDEGTGVGPAVIDYNILYTAASTASFRQHSALIRGGSGAKSNDIYYFNVDSSDTHGFRRLAWSSGSSNWSGSWTSRATFGGDVNDSQGYNLKTELLSKPVYASGQDKVYVGIARWLDNTNGDTQSLYSVDSSDSVSLVSNIYSAGGAHCLYPTLDLAYDSVQDKLYFYYLKTGSASVCGHTYYKTYDGSSLGSETAFFTLNNRSVDIPVTYPSRYDDKILLFFRVNNESTPGTPPHDVYFGYTALNSATAASSTSITSPVTHTTYAEFDNMCAVKSSTQAINDNGGEVGLSSSLRDDFETPDAPYSQLFTSNWGTTGVWSTGTYNPSPDGTLLVYNSGGAYVLGANTYTKKTLDFRAKFTAHNFQHVGWVDSTDFTNYIIFSTGSNGQMNARVNAGGGETSSALGSSYLGDFHNYRIEWGSSVLFYIDDFTTPVATINVNDSASLYPILSNNTTTVGSNLTIDWIRLHDHQTSGSYISCPLDSGTTGAVWGTLSYSSSEPTGTTLSLSTRTSSDNSTWSSWSSALTSGDSISSTAARYLQYRATFTGTTATTSLLRSITLSFSAPTPPPPPPPSPSPSPAAVNGPVFGGSIFFNPLNNSINPGSNISKNNIIAPVFQNNVVTKPVSNKYVFTKDLYFGLVDKDVKALQQYLNNNGFPVAPSGVGSKGRETNIFGFATRNALRSFQKAKKIDPAVGYFGPKTINYINNN